MQGCAFGVVCASALAWKAAFGTRTQRDKFGWAYSHRGEPPGADADGLALGVSRARLRLIRAIRQLVLIAQFIWRSSGCVLRGLEETEKTGTPILQSYARGRRGGST